MMLCVHTQDFKKKKQQQRKTQVKILMIKSNQKSLNKKHENKMLG